MRNIKRITRNDINKKNMVALSYCQCQTILNRFGYEYKIGENIGVNGWNYNLYRINGVDIVAGYNAPYTKYSNKEIKNKLVALENKIRANFDYSKRDEYKKEFFEIFE